MLAEINIIPLSQGMHHAEEIADVVELIMDSGLEYQVTALGTIVEGSPDAVWGLLRRCHEHSRERNARVLTEIRIDDRSDADHEIHRDVERVEELLARRVQRSA